MEGRGTRCRGAYSPTAQATALATSIKELSPEELLVLAEAKEEELVAAGEIDVVGDFQPTKAPKLDDSIVSEDHTTWEPYRDGLTIQIQANALCITGIVKFQFGA